MNMEHLVDNIIENFSNAEKIKQSLETLNEDNLEELIKLIKLIKPFVAEHYRYFVSKILYDDGQSEPIWCTDCDLLTNFKYSAK